MCQFSFLSLFSPAFAAKSFSSSWFKKQTCSPPSESRHSLLSVLLTYGLKKNKKKTPFDLIKILTTESRVFSKSDSSACLKLKRMTWLFYTTCEILRLIKIRQKQEQRNHSVKLHCFAYKIKQILSHSSNREQLCYLYVPVTILKKSFSEKLFESYILKKKLEKMIHP